MNHTLWSSVGARVIAVTFVLAGIAACERKDVTTRAAEVSPSAQVIGVEPAPPTGDPPGTTPVGSNTTYVSKDVENQSMPVPGQPNDHSNLAAKPPQKAETPDALHSVDEAKKANSGEAPERSPQ